MSNPFLTMPQIIEYIRCDKCNTRDLSRLDVGYTLQGLQVYCMNCNKNLIHIQLKGEIQADTCKHGTFNTRNSRNTESKTNDYIVSSFDLATLAEEEKTNSGIENKIRHDYAR